MIAQLTIDSAGRGDNENLRSIGGHQTEHGQQLRRGFESDRLTEDGMVAKR